MATRNRFLTYSVAAPAAYAPAYRDEVGEGFAELITEALLSDAVSAGESSGGTGTSTRKQLTALFREAVTSATMMVDSLAGGIVQRAPQPQLVACSISVDSQKLPSAAIAAGLRRRGFSGLVLAGGSALDGPMGEAFLARFPEFDAVLQGEAESNWRSFLDSLGGDWRGSTTPGLIRRIRGKVTANPTTVPQRLWRLSRGAFDDYLDQRASCGWDGPLVLPAESSRGCWWADLNRCTFCAVDPAAHPYRVQDPRQVAEVVSREWRTHRPVQIALTDSCMPRRAHSDVLSALRTRAEHENWKLYYEVKSTLHRLELKQLKEAGISEVQPGIESFNTDTLKDFGKGANRLQHVNFLKWCRFYSIAVSYPILYGAPTETPARLEDMSELIERIMHLPPPVQLNRLRLYRGSGYWRARGDYGFSEVAPLACDRLAYDDDGPGIEDLVFSFRYRLDRPDADRYKRALEALRDRVEQWQTSYSATSLNSADAGTAIIVTRIDNGSPSMQVVDDPLAMAVMRGCEEVALLARLRKSLGAEEQPFRRVVSHLKGDGILEEEGGRALNLTIPI